MYTEPDIHLEADYEDRNGDPYPYGDDDADLDEEYEEDENDEENEEYYSDENDETDDTGEVRYFEQYSTNQNM